MSAHRHIVITGAGGWIGSLLASKLLSEPDFADITLTLADISVPAPPADRRVRVVEGDLSEPGVVARMLNGRADVVFHLASILGGTAEANYALARKVNLDATLDLFEALRDDASPPRVVFASSIAVFGPPLPERINDDTMPVPFMHYGGQKRMAEIAIEQLSAHGWIDGIAIRLPGIVARRGADARLKSAFINTMFYDYAEGKDFIMPVSAEGTMWLISVDTCVNGFIHAARVPRDALKARRALTLPALRVSMEALIEELGRLYPESRSVVRWEPQAQLEELFTRQPPLETPLGDSLGFQHDGTIETLVRRAIQPE
ncbi:NAD-dependent epimerase/dehydratase family protein [Aquisediminimonas profunda]|uniref:NAD-dependent epimerase/dehydratase family protein n=1 Tax=Aquisediminimonas profunda TaxID=1550733 RepID=UPI001C634D9E|nr:NAD-dependent epimerase/dehydratase family protein [Aquisediminimonas profunda]